MNTIELNNNPLVFWGDNHGNWSELYQFILRKKTNSIHSEWNCIQVGDMGMGMRDRDIQKQLLDELNKFLKKNNSFLYIIRGNHDDPNYFNGLYKLRYSNIYFIEDYTVLVHPKFKILCIGGAISIDRSLRKQWNQDLAAVGKDYQTWFKRENFKYDKSKIDEIHEAFDIDIIVTHTAPSNFPPVGFNDFVRQWVMRDDLTRTEADKINGVDLLYELIQERKELDKIFSKFIFSKPPKKWFYGHFHFSEKSTHGKYNELTAHLLNIDEFYVLE